MKTLKRLSRLLLVAVFSLSALTVSQTSLAASNVQGYINGQVLTDAGDGVSGATVTVTNLNTGFTRTTTTEADGDFRFTSLPVGNYRIVAEAAGQPTTTRESVGVNVGTGTDVYIVMGEEAAELGEVTVAGAAISPIDISSTESATILGEQTVDRLPVARNLTAVALLAPGTTRGDSAFGNLASFGGSTVGENVCYINGLNVTNFRDGLGCGSVPFEFYQEFQLKTGGFSAEFGRSTGGVINAVTKSGSNEYHYGFNLYWTPWIDDLVQADPNVYTPTGPTAGTLVRDYADDESDGWNLALYASGPIVKDKAFFYVLYNPRSQSSTNYNRPSDVYIETESDDAFWGLKLDWNLTNNHVLELTAFSDSTEFTSDSWAFTDADSDGVYTRGAYEGALVSDNGGDNYILKYTGYLTPDFTLSASYGVNKYALSNFAPAEPLVLERPLGASQYNVINNPLGGGPYGFDEDEREQYRIDAEWFIGDHQLRFGADYETRTTDTDVGYTGVESYTSPNADLIGGPGVTFAGGNIYYVRDFFGLGFLQAAVRHYSIDGGFETETNAIYVEDKWQVSDNFVLSLGLRNEEFNNMQRDGTSFIEMKDQLAPRLGFSWDAMGDGTLKVFGNYGRYYLPVANNTNVRFAGGETYFYDFYVWDGTYNGEYNIPGYDPATYLGSVTYADGSVPDVSSTIDADLDPMYQDEYIIGVLKELESGWTVGVRGIRRDLKSTIEDAVIGSTGGTAPPAYALINPGEPVTLCYDTGCVTYTAAESGYTESSRYYNAIEFLFERVWDGEWFLKGSYTWSQSYGNNEGYVKSDNGQTDAGITSNFDYPGFLDGAYGYLPNDRRHSLKLFGAWQFHQNWQVGANLLMESGRPYAALGVHPTSADAASYGAESFYQNGELVPRGSRGRTPFISSLDLSLKYMTKVGDADMKLGVDLFNVFGAQNAKEIQEQAEFGVGSGQTGPGQPDYNYLTPTAFQQGRYIRLSAEFDF